MIQYYIGLDLGQSHDFTALTVVERLDMPGSTETGKRPGKYNVVDLYKFPLRTAYSTVVSKVKSFLASEPLTDSSKLIIDETGVGAPIGDLLRQEGLHPISVIITHGSSVSRERNRWLVPKRDLVTLIRLLLETGRLKIAQDLPLAETLRTELLSFRAKTSLAGHDVYEAWRENEHDDLVLALALAVWYGERIGGQPVFDVPVTAHVEPRWPTFRPPDPFPSRWY